MTTRLPLVLEEIRIATPCAADWDDMTGDAQVRFCGRCEKNVYNLSQMTRAEAEALVRDKEGRLCVRFYRRADGTVLTADCPVGVRRARLRQRVWAALSGVAASAALLLGVATGRARADLAIDGKKPTTHHEPAVQVAHQVMGGAVAVTPPPMLMGKIAAPTTTPPKKATTVAPKPKQPAAPVMGEPAPVMGDIAAPAPTMGTMAAPKQK